MLIYLYTTIYLGLQHAFEADHLLAVSNLVTHRNNIWKSVKDGIYWGIGHTSTIFFIGILMMVFKFQISMNIFGYFEGGVGVMLIILGIYRFLKLFSRKKNQEHSHTHIHTHTYSHEHSHSHFHEDSHDHSHHRAAFGVGLVHGLAGSGVLMVLVISQMKNALDGLMYILIFGLGSIVGMFLAAFLFSIPFAKNLMKSGKFQIVLVIISSVLCIVYGGKVAMEQFF
ncbi:MAG: sulfite exporter TauE/SafE family protein [Flavobacteriaceae bacterium]|jgi:ABC-type nickel/cobalt efflux system permease component RcnA|nr:sulfite exporter TauE/SafE family protein [Flavobacteriaceae bacterium]